MGPVFEIGVEYNPKSVLDLETLSVHNLKLGGTKFVRITWVDLSNIVRFRVVSLPYFEKVVSSQRPGVAVAKAALGLLDLNLAEGFSAEKPPYRDSNGNLSVEVALCPRTALKRVVERAKNDFAAEFLVGFESEFILLKNTKPVEAVGAYEFSSSSSLRSGASATVVMGKIAQAVLASGIELQMYHGEGASGQYEIRDYLQHRRYGLRATFAPRVFDGIGTAPHAHISIHSTRPGDEKSNTGMSNIEKSFLAGIMQHLPSLPALALPTPASYKRVGDGVWSGGTYVCWGTETRETPVRLTNATSRTSRRFEMRFIDGTANPYLALAGILGAGDAGILSNKDLTVMDCSGPQSAAQMTQVERQALGISARMPLTWEEARKNFAASQEMQHILGRDLMTGYLSVNKLTADIFEQDSDAIRKTENSSNSINGLKDSSHSIQKL